MEILYQENPFKNCTYTQCRNRSFTDCLESYQYGAHKESMILRWNHRLPTKELVLNFLQVLSPKEINDYLKMIFDYLKEHGIEAIANIEFTTRGKYKKPNNTVHSHMLTDDPRKIKDLIDLLIAACESIGLIKGTDFWISNHRELPDPDGYIDYFTKYGYSHKVILFKPKTGINKFYTIGKWFKKGRGKGQIWNEIKASMREKYAIDPDQAEAGKGQESINKIEVPLGEKPNIDFERRYLREKYGIDLDKVTGGDESIEKFYYPGIGKFSKFPSSGWLLVEEIQSLESIQENGDHKTPNTEERGDRYIRLKCHNGHLTPIDGRIFNPASDFQFDAIYHLPPKRIQDRRHEWERYKYDVSFLQ